ncbi:FecR domain-containing protein [Reichenbachiella sp. MALMAid0571]|uniref:FecR family protein n=1 Tax=Reichenbachiella sp. MALMAid0571 TaxID=3143939 RepID=UPI0032DFC514
MKNFIVNKLQMDYLDYTVEDFVLDEYFQKWILDNDSMTASFWEAWLNNYPHKRVEVEKARQLVLSIRLKEDFPTQDEFDGVWNNVILRRNREKANNPPVFQVFRAQYLPIVFKVAAVLVVALFLGLSLSHFWQNRDEIQPDLVTIKEVVKQTGKGEKLTFQLADGSLVKLNSNSKLVFPEFFDSNNRTVKLKGEAFFEVEKDKERPFRIITGDIGTQVLGTSFNVKAYKVETDLITVAVVTGKVSVGSFEGNIVYEQILLEPGEMASYDQSEKSFEKSTFRYDEVVGWRDGILSFKDLDIQSIIKIIERWYDVKIVLEKNDIDLDKDFTGKYKNKTLDAVLKGLSFAYEFEYEIDHHIVIIK